MSKSYNKKYSSKSRSGKQSRGKDTGAKGSYDERSTQKESLTLAGVGNTNDPSWYQSIPQFVKDVCNIPINQIMGDNITDIGISFKETAGTKSSIPGIMVFDFIPVPGLSTDANSGLNLAANNMFQMIRTRLSTVNTSYEAADLAMCMLGVDSIYTLYCHIMRAFGLLQLYSSDNLYYNRAIFKAIYKSNDTQYNKARTTQSNGRAYFNNIIYKASQLYLPTNFNITKRHAALCNTIYRDGDTNKGQLYAFSPSYVFQIDEELSDQGTCLKPVPVPDDLASMLLLFDTLVEQYRNSTSMNKIFADMRRAFGDQNRFELAYCDDAYVAPIVRDDYILYQIYNANLPVPVIDSVDFPTPTDPTKDRYTKCVYQNVDKNVAIFNPTMACNSVSYRNMIASAPNIVPTSLYNFHSAEVTPELLLEASRLKYGYKAIGTASVDRALQFTTMGTEWITNVTAYDMSGILVTFNHVETTQTISDVSTLMQLSGVWSVFDWAPCVYMVTGQSLDDGQATMIPMWDMDNYVDIGRKLQDQLNKNVMLNIWFNQTLSLE